MDQPREISFRAGVPAVGQTTLCTSEEETRLQFTGTRVSDGARVCVVSMTRSRRVRREEILDVHGNVARRLRVAFLEEVTETDNNGAKAESAGPLAGGTFEIERRDGGADLEVREAGGVPARREIAERVAGLYGDFGREDAPIRLPGGPQCVGQSAPEIAESLAAGVARGAAISRVEITDATLAEILPGPAGALHGVYRVGMKVQGESGGSLVAMELSGTILLRDVDGAPLEVRLQGPLRSTPSPEAGGNIPGGEGEFRMSQTLVTTLP
jgi:hypothetical protein